ncbi:coiled-coil domain-containing protein [Planomonospora parontospora]|uniref:coiled-coil domain-containing protein n=1 Tax=Planomonospora parontospora TaxID=58119 RepID=UPI0019B79CA2|nr:hypothetical protein [Planomonospora parontospora]GGL41469.1 hypothetical protein GCM10014719_48450 [Planomonospora parontospora subsp. antibiotica]GII17974.1 hypothetical protein Ppa05_47000 [Planomonospora parontospora subsp. antibiotica]
MAAPSPTSPMFRHRLAATACVISAFGVVFGPPSPAAAAPKPREAELRKELNKLTTKVDALIEAYAAKRESLKKAQKAESVAKENLSKAEDAYAEAKKQVDSIAQLRYQSDSGDLPALLFGDGDMSGAAMLEQLAAQQGAYLDGFARSRDARKQASDRAAQLTEDLRRESEHVEEQRRDAEELIGAIKKKIDQLVPLGSGRRANGTWAPQLPNGADNITDRTRNMREAIRKRFALPYAVGCYRPINDGGEHPLGRACDFMMSAGGAMPSAANLRLGDEIAAWAVKNKDKLGVKYVIWRQRINHGSGWRFMSDRGSVTANHYDHPHISMY